MRMALWLFLFPFVLKHKTFMFNACSPICFKGASFNLEQIHAKQELILKILSFFYFLVFLLVPWQHSIRLLNE